MIIIHAGILHNDFILWGERSLAERDVREAPPAHPASGPPPSALPFDAGATALADALTQADIAVHLDGAQPVILWLPTVGHSPLASSHLIAAPPRSHAHPRLQPWRVTGYRVAGDAVLALLSACDDTRMLTTGVAIGDDLAYWAFALRFAGALVARQHFLPAICQRDGGYHACWEPVLLGEEPMQSATLAKAMPAVARALHTRSDAEPDAPAQQPLLAFLGIAVDALVRKADQHPADSAVQSIESLHDLWIHQLRVRGNSDLAGNADAFAQLTAQVREWHRPISVTAEAPFRLCFRLEEPETTPTDDGTTATWYVRYLLQPKDDPSLLIPAADIWKARGKKSALLKRGNLSAREYLLGALGQASSLSYQIEESLKTATPDGYTLDTSGAHEFLSVIAPALEQSGFGVMLPAWWSRRGTRVRMHARAKAHSPEAVPGAGLSLDDIVHFNWELALGDEVMPLQELQALANLKSPLVKIRGQWVELHGDDLQHALTMLQERSGEAPARDIVRMALGAAPTIQGVEFEGITTTGWIDDLLTQLQDHAAQKELPVPRGFHGELRPYQQRGYAWLSFLRQWGLGACLADDMGLGKTIQALTLLQHEREIGKTRPVLLLCPTSVVTNWQKEAARFTPDLPVLVHHGADRLKSGAFTRQAKKHALVITSYALLYRDFESLRKVPWGGIILDEAQNIKNPETKQARAARALQAEYRIALTGTPVENHVGELWSIMEFLNPGLLGTRHAFHEQFFVPIQGLHDPLAAARLKRLTNPFILRRLKTDRSIINDLPEKQEAKVYCPLTREQASLYLAVTRDAEQLLESADEGIQRKGLILSTLLKLKQVCNHPAQFLGDRSALVGRSGKLTRLTEMLDEILHSGERALVFTQFAEMGHLLQRHLQETFGREIFFLHGGVPKAKRDLMVEQFQAAGEASPIFILSLKAGGTGLNLTQANHVFHFDRWWNPAVEDQATDRAFRIGQTKNVQVHKFVCAGTLEDKIDEMIERKKRVASQIIGTNENWLTELSNRELKELFSLQMSAVADEL